MSPLLSCPSFCLSSAAFLSPFLSSIVFLTPLFLITSYAPISFSAQYSVVQKKNDLGSACDSSSDRCEDALLSLLTQDGFMNANSFHFRSHKWSDQKHRRPGRTLWVATPVTTSSVCVCVGSVPVFVKCFSVPFRYSWIADCIWLCPVAILLQVGAFRGKFEWLKRTSWMTWTS